MEDNPWMPTYKKKLKDFIMIENNLNDNEDKRAMNSITFYENFPLGKKSRLFGISKNNVSESQAHVANRNGIRLIIPPLGIKRWLEYSINTVNKYYAIIDEMWMKKTLYINCCCCI